MNRSNVLAALAPLLFATSVEASMSDLIISGEILDSRVVACGIRIIDGEVANLRPFIEASADVSGSFRANLTKKSASGTSMISQGNAFSAGSLGNTQMAVDRPSEISIWMSIDDTNGKPLCRLDATKVFQAPEIRT